jgi:predicted DNA-binding protein (MmcQ/YjbR family)
MNITNKSLELRQRVTELSHVIIKQMFGYECYSVKGRFFVGFSKKDNSKVIIRFRKNEQQKAIKNLNIKPFSYGAKAGWIEIRLDSNPNKVEDVYQWIEKSYRYALNLANQK